MDYDEFNVGSHASVSSCLDVSRRVRNFRATVQVAWIMPKFGGCDDCFYSLGVVQLQVSVSEFCQGKEKTAAAERSIRNGISFTVEKYVLFRTFRALTCQENVILHDGN